VPDAGSACEDFDVLADFLQNEDSTDPMACAQAGCHGPDSPSAGLDLATEDLAGRLIGEVSDQGDCAGQPLLDPAAPEQSLLYSKLTSRACGLRMPLGASDPVPDSHRACLLEWIASLEDGAGSEDGGASTGGGDAGTSDAGTAGEADPGMSSATIWIEAEAGMLSAPYETGSDPEASGGSFVEVAADATPAFDTPPAVGLTLPFTVSDPGTYRIWGRIGPPDTDHDSVWVRVDGGTFVKWNDTPHMRWVWDDVHDADADPAVAVTYELDSGDHTLELAHREPGMPLDKFAITADADFVPSGLGE
jgi:hypothetical protein